MPARVLLAGAPELPRELRVGEQLEAALRRTPRGLSTRKPVSPSVICSGMPPTLPPMNGRPFHIASVTVRPKPSRVDFWITTSACAWNALTSIDADAVEVVEDLDVLVAVGVRRASR